MSDLLHQLCQPASTAEWYRFAVVIGGLFLFIGIGEGLRKQLQFSPEVTRKLVHVLTGILIFFAPSLFSSAIPPLTMAVTFILVNGLAIRFHLFRGMHGTDRPTYGTVYYPLAFLVLVVIFWYRSPELVSLGMLSLAIGDALAAIVGNAVPHPTIYRLTGDKKSVEGSAAMFLSTFAALGLGMWFLFGSSKFSPGHLVLAAGAAAAVATACEALSARGFDNLTIPLSVAFVLQYYLIPVPLQDVSQFTLGIGLALLIGLVSYQAGFLTSSGSVATFLLATVVFGIGGWKWTIPILLFFILSSLLSRAGKGRKALLASVFEKSGARDYVQVGANGGVAGVIIILQYVFPSVDFFPAFIGSVAAATADTWGTEIGLLSGTPPRSIVTFRRVERGANGGVTLAGLSGAAAGSVLIGVAGVAGGLVWATAAIAIAAGFVGALVDSYLGATLQAGYRCPVCGKQTEHTMHCDMPTKHVRGFRFLNNDSVNFACTLSGAVLTLLFLSIRLG